MVTPVDAVRWGTGEGTVWVAPAGAWIDVVGTAGAGPGVAVEPSAIAGATGVVDVPGVIDLAGVVICLASGEDAGFVVAGSEAADGGGTGCEAGRGDASSRVGLGEETISEDGGTGLGSATSCELWPAAVGGVVTVTGCEAVACGTTDCAASGGATVAGCAGLDGVTGLGSAAPGELWLPDVGAVVNDDCCDVTGGATTGGEEAGDAAAGCGATGATPPD